MSKDHTPSKITSRHSCTRTRKQNTCMQQIIYDQQPHIRPNNQAPPINQTTQKAKSSNPNTPTPHKANHTPTDLQNKKSPLRHHKQLI